VTATPLPPAGAPPLPSTTTAGLRIDRARPGDLRAVRRIQVASFPPKLAYSLGTLLLLWALPGVRFLVARQGDEVVGCIIGDRQDGRARVVNIAVAPQARRRGVGEALLAALELALPAGEIILMAQVENTAARRLYDRCGYEEIGIANGYYGPGRDGVWMRKRRPPTARASTTV
jgi:ribosomal-protein-alanine N-acetyltransferase